MSVERKKKNTTEIEQQQIINFFEELCWLLDSNKNINFNNASKNLKTIRNNIMHGITFETSTITSLIGVLPSLLKDLEIFPSLAQLAQFAKEILGIEISRWDKRSRNEIIGLIICEVEDSNKERMDILLEWSNNILNNKKRVQEMQEKAKNEGNIFSWNETIQKLTGR